MPVLEIAKKGYLLWNQYLQTLAKSQRYSLGLKIDCLFVEIIEAISIAVFLKKEEKLPYVRIAIRKLDTLKILLMILWETKALDNKKYITLSKPLSDLGRQLGGWNGNLSKPAEKQNSPDKK